MQRSIEAAEGAAMPSVQQGSPRTLEARQFRDVLGSFTTGVVVVTTLGEDGRPIGLTVNSFNSVSLDPPLILWSLALKSPSLAAFRQHAYFAINILAEDQEPLCRQFATPSSDKFANIRFDRGVTGVPVLHATAAYLECRAFARYPGGDHEIHVGEVMAVHDHGAAPLVFHRGSVRRLIQH
ncbi:flavin reductase family protein [Lichenifustis flavocetrariae]|uniref:Flavin reductase family protein n=1 Tax=Lichenifustis flavocetrariae TaxID=2949735 RepID=A0AA41Z1M0_9HYPH|nr:flavin reductase family protein [Lichenifustis flavocetrariae]MCW6511188.1 flavin reductase family protein [Lichenifustis flavocetrariae]